MGIECSGTKFTLNTGASKGPEKAVSRGEGGGGVGLVRTISLQAVDGYCSWHLPRYIMTL